MCAASRLWYKFCSMPYYVGVDAGGTKTECAVGDDHSILGRSTAASCKVQRVGEAAARAALHDSITRACEAAGVSPRNVACTCLGIAGASDTETAVLVECMAREMCSQSKDPKACQERVAKMKDKMKEARTKASKACEGKSGDAQRDCMRKEMCAQAKDPARCEARSKERMERRGEKK